MKKFGILGLISVIVIALLAVLAPAHAQRIGNPAVLISTSLTNASVASTNVVDVSAYATVSVQATLTDLGLVATDTNTVAISTEVSLDGDHWLTGPSLTVTAIGSNTVSTCISNFAVLPYRQWRPITLDNSTSPTNACLSLVGSTTPGL